MIHHHPKPKPPPLPPEYSIVDTTVADDDTRDLIHQVSETLQEHYDNDDLSIDQIGYKSENFANTREWREHPFDLDLDDDTCSTSELTDLTELTMEPDLIPLYDTQESIPEKHDIIRWGKKVQIMNHSIVSPEAMAWITNAEERMRIQERERLALLHAMKNSPNFNHLKDNTEGRLAVCQIEYEEACEELERVFDEDIEVLRVRALQRAKTDRKSLNLPSIIQCHMDGGANCSITDKKELIMEYKPIKKNINSADKTTSMAVEGRGYINMVSLEGYIIPTPIYHCPTADDTIISMADMCLKNKDMFNQWTQDVHLEYGRSVVTLRGYGPTVTLPCITKHNLQYYYMPNLNTHLPKDVDITNTEIDEDTNIGKVNQVKTTKDLSMETKDPPLVVRKLTTQQNYELWHQRAGHPGDRITQMLHRTSIGVPHLKPNAFYKCATCIKCKMAKQGVTNHGTKVIQIPMTDEDYDNYFSDSISEAVQPGQMIHADFGFVRGSDYVKKTISQKTITSIQGYNCYLIIVDRATRMIALYLRSDKKPAIKEFTQYLERYGARLQGVNKTIRTDQGGELWNSSEFKKMIEKAGYSLEPTGADNSKQNGVAENPNKVLAAMTRTLLHNAGLGSEFWCWAMTHAVYLKNRLPHRSLHDISPYEARTGRKPNLAQLRIWGCRVYVRKPGKRKHKTDLNYYRGIFLGYTNTNKNIHYYDIDNKTFKIATHAVFDEAGMTVNEISPGNEVLQRVGYSTNYNLPTTKTNIDSVEISITSDKARIPTRGSDGAAGYDLTSPGNFILQPHKISMLPLDFKLALPKNSYCQITSRSSTVVKRGFEVKAGVIDEDYRGIITVVLYNFSDEPVYIKEGEKIAQMIFHSINYPSLTEVLELTPTQRNEGGFGSTDLKVNLLADVDQQVITQNPSGTCTEDSDLQLAPLEQIIEEDDLPYPITYSRNPYDDEMLINLEIISYCKNPTSGLKLQQCKDTGRVIMHDIEPGTSAARIPRWRQLRGSSILKINDQIVTNIQDVIRILQSLKDNKKDQTTIVFGIIDKNPMHPVRGVPQLYFDQLNIVDNHIKELSHEYKELIRKERQEAIDQQAKIIEDTQAQSTTFEDTYYTSDDSDIDSDNDEEDTSINQLTIHRLTRRILQKQEDWQEWNKSEFKQLDAYEAQNMFGEPCEPPYGKNILPLLWTYLVKVDGTKKARCVCNGNPKNKGSVTLDHTYAGSLEQTGARIFWSLTAAKNYIAIGADVSNAFAEAEAPKAELYVTIDKQYREWYYKKHGKHIPANCTVLPVKRALQGHPESSRLWAILINKILIKLGMKPCRHEACLYRGHFDGHEIYFLRQVDDFALSSKSIDTCQKLIHRIQSEMTMPVHDLGIIKWFNGVDIMQGKHYIKMHMGTYIKKISEKPWLKEDKMMSVPPIPMSGDNKYTRQLEEAPTPSTDLEREELKKLTGMNYRQCIGELIYAMITARPDISFPLIKLSQYSANPGKLHYQSVKDIYYYLKATMNEGIHFWRTEENANLPIALIPKLQQDNYDNKERVEIQDPYTIIGMSDATWGEDRNHGRSVSGIIIRLAGGTVYYKSCFQKTISLSTTESEYTAAVEAGKAILYVRSILHDMGVPQDSATTLYQDNSGAYYMAAAGKPSKRTRHMDIKYFALNDWIERDLIAMKMIGTSSNTADAMTKNLQKNLFYRHFDEILGIRIPQYARFYKELYQQNFLKPPIIDTVQRIYKKRVSGTSSLFLTLLRQLHSLHSVGG